MDHGHGGVFSPPLPTHFETFRVYVPWMPFENRGNGLPPDFQISGPHQPVDGDPFHPLDLTQYLQGNASVGVASITGPQTVDTEGWLPRSETLPYAIRFANAPDAQRHVSEVRIVTSLDDDLDLWSFRLGDIRIGSIQVQVPVDRALFQGEFDFSETAGFVLRISAGIDQYSREATWLLQAIDPLTGELLQDPNRGLLPPNNALDEGAGFVSYTVRADEEEVKTGATIAASARILFDTAPPEQTPVLSQLLDAVVPQTELQVVRLAEGTANYRLTWESQDDSDGSGFKHVTLYIATDGGEYRIWQRQLTQASGSLIFEGTSEKSYEFLALATDVAGNREQPGVGVRAQDDGSRVNLGAPPTVPSTTLPNFGVAPVPSPTPATNPLFVQAERLIPAVTPPARSSEFEFVLRPFVARSFATGIEPSHAEIGPMALVEMPQGDIVVSGGPARNWLYRFDRQGGEAAQPWAELPYPIFNLAMDSQGRLWATTGGGPLLQLDPDSGRILGEYGEGVTMALAIEPATGLIYVAVGAVWSGGVAGNSAGSGGGVQVFDPASATFRPYSRDLNLRVASLAFAPDGSLWATTWPDRKQVVRLNDQGRGELMLEFAADVDSLAFGQIGTQLEGLLFVSHNTGANRLAGSELTLVDLVTLRRVTVADGGSRGDVIITTQDGRVLLSQSNQVDVLNPATVPLVLATSPPGSSSVSLPLSQVRVTFDQEMFVHGSLTPKSATNLRNYRLLDQNNRSIAFEDAIYLADSFTVVLTIPNLEPGPHTLIVSRNITSNQGLSLSNDYYTTFTAVSDFSTLLDLQFTKSRSNRAEGTVSWDVVVTNTAPYDVVLPLILILDPALGYDGVPVGASGQAPDGRWFIDLSSQLPSTGILAAGASTVGRSLTIYNRDDLRIDFGFGVGALPTANQRPVFESTPLTTATIGEAYQYQLVARDPDGTALFYFLEAGPAGMQVDSLSGLITWLPDERAQAATGVLVSAYDARGGRATQSFVIDVGAGNRAPLVGTLPKQIDGVEGQLIRFILPVVDLDGDQLAAWVDGLPPGASLDPRSLTFTWTPDFYSAGTYEDVSFRFSDGILETSITMTFLIEPADQGPELIQPIDRTLREGDRLRFYLRGSDPDGTPVTFSSYLLPPGARLDLHTGLFDWTPDYYMAGTYTVPFTVSSGELSVTKSATFTVMNANGAPVFDELTGWRIAEGQPLALSAFAYDPDHPDYETPIRDPQTGELILRSVAPPPVTYQVMNLPPGARFDADEAIFYWVPTYEQAGTYSVTFTAQDDGDETGTPLVTMATIELIVMNLNRAPEIAPIQNQDMSRDTTSELLVAVTDPDGNPVVLTAENAQPGFPLPHFVTFDDQGNGTGRFQFAPTIGDRGDYLLTLLATDDGDGGGPWARLQTAFTFRVTVEVENEPPILEYVGDKVLVVGEPLTWTLRARDADQEPLQWSLAGLPASATLSPGSVYGTQLLSWTPTAQDLGSRTVTLNVTDGGNGNLALAATDSETFTFRVRSSNVSPWLPPVSDREVPEGQLLQFSLGASDSDGDVLTYRAENLPEGAQLDPGSGQFSWRPAMYQAGRYEDLRVIVSDGNRSRFDTFTILVSNVNRAPQIVPLEPLFMRETSELTFTMAASDADGDPINFSVRNLPNGASFNPTTGGFRWTPNHEQAGDYVVTFTASDPLGGTSSTDVTLRIDNVNRPPVVDTSYHAVRLTEELRFFVRAVDPDANTVLTYSATNLPSGATLSSLTGEFVWTPGPGQAGEYVVGLLVSDGAIVSSQAIVVRAAVELPSPQVTIELTPSFPSRPGQPVVIHVLADSLADIIGLTVTIDGQPLILNADGRATIVADRPGQRQIVAVATDADGLVGSQSLIWKVRDPLDTEAPRVELAASFANPLLVDGVLRGTVSDLNLDNWTLELRRQDQDLYQLLATGTQPVTGGELARLDLLDLPNGFYVLRLTARDVARRVARTEALIEVRTPTKRAFIMQETDLTVTVGGVAVEVTRVYDSTRRELTGRLGPGWRLVSRELDIYSDVPLTGLESQGMYFPFRTGTQLYMLSPNNERLAFRFMPVERREPGLVYYTPVWQPLPESAAGWSLTTPGLRLDKGGDQYFLRGTGQPYNPLNPAQAYQDFVLAAPDGLRYGVDGTLGMVSQVDMSGRRVFIGDSGIVATTGESLQFIYDTAGRLTRLIAPDGRVVVYQYDQQGLLTAVREPASGAAVRYGYVKDSARLQSSIEARDQGITIDYQPDTLPVANPILTDLGTAGSFAGRGVSGVLTVNESHRFTFSVRESELLSTFSSELLIRVSARRISGTLQLQPPQISGLTPRTVVHLPDRVDALYAVDRAGLFPILLTAQGATAGEYELQVWVAGDLQSDGIVDGRDSQLLADAQGTQFGEAAYRFAADLDGNGRIDRNDALILVHNYGFFANQAPEPISSQLTRMTYTDLELRVALDSLLRDPDGDPLLVEILQVEQGQAWLSADGRRLSFLPAAGYAGPARVTLRADDGFNRSPVTQLDIQVSDAELLGMELHTRQPKLVRGERASLEIVGLFADQQRVPLFGAYLTYASSQPSVLEVNGQGMIQGRDTGFAAVTVRRGKLAAATAVTVGEPLDPLQREEDGITVYPRAVTLPVVDGQRPFLVSAGAVNLTRADMGTIYVVSDERVISVSADGLVESIGAGTATLTILSGPAQLVVPIRVVTPEIGQARMTAEGGVISTPEGVLVQIAPESVPVGTVVTLNTLSMPPTDELPPSDIYRFGTYFELDLGGMELSEPAQMSIPVGGDFLPGDTVYFFKKELVMDEAGVEHEIWMLLETGRVDAAGVARTTSPPYPGLSAGGQYLAAKADQPERLVQIGLNAPPHVGYSIGVDWNSGIGIPWGGGLIPFFPTLSLGISFLTYKRHPREVPAATQHVTIAAPSPGSVYIAEVLPPQIDAADVAPQIQHVSLTSLNPPALQLQGSRMEGGYVVFLQGGKEIDASTEFFINTTLSPVNTVDVLNNCGVQTQSPVNLSSSEVQLGYWRGSGTNPGYGTGDDFCSQDYPQFNPPETLVEATFLTFRRLNSDSDLEHEFRTYMYGLAIESPALGQEVVSRFMAGTGQTFVHGVNSRLSIEAKESTTFQNALTSVNEQIAREIQNQANEGRVNVEDLRDQINLPSLDFSFFDSTALLLKSIIGGTQGGRLILQNFAASGQVFSPEAGGIGSYSGTLRFHIYDDFGVDRSDLYAPPLAAFWILQHERVGPAPYVNEIIIEVPIEGNFVIPPGVDTVILNGATTQQIIQSDTQTTVRVPAGVILGLADIVVRHPRYGDSNAARLTSRGGLAAVGQTGLGVTLFSSETNRNEVRAQFEFGGGGSDTVFTPDLSRMYGAAYSRIGVVDTIRARQVDVNPDTPEMDYIRIDGDPFIHQLAIDPQGQFLFAAGPAATVWVIDIRPESDTFHQVLRTIDLPRPRVSISGIAVNADGTRLLVGTGAQFGTGHLTVFALEPRRPPNSRNRNPEGWGRLLYEVFTDSPPHAIQTVEGHPNLAVMTYRYQVRSLSPWGTFGTISPNLQRFATITLGANSATLRQVMTRVEGGTLNPLVNYFYSGYYTNILTPRDVVVSPDLSAAFIADWELYLVFGYGGQRGDKVGVVADPFGTARYLGATTPIDWGLVTSVTLNADASRLMASYGGFGEVLVMDTSELLSAGRGLTPTQSERNPLDLVNLAVHITPITVRGLVQGLSAQKDGLQLPDLEVTQLSKPIARLVNGRVQVPQNVRLTYKLTNNGLGAVDDDVVNWTEQVWLGTDADITAPNNQARRTWHARVHVGTFTGPRAVGTQVTRSIPLDLLKNIELPDWINENDLQWIVLVDWPDGQDSRDALQSDAIDEWNERNAEDNRANAFLFPFTGIDISPLYADGRFEYLEANQRYESSGEVLLGWKPENNGDFSALLSLSGTVSLTEESITATGSATALVGNLNGPLWTATWQIPIGNSTATEFQELGSIPGEFTLAGADVKFSTFHIHNSEGASSADAELVLQGAIILPRLFGNYAVPFGADRPLILSRRGFELPRITIANPNLEFEVGFVQVRAEELIIEYNQLASELRVGGRFTLPQLNAVVDLRIEDGNYFRIRARNRTNALGQDGSILSATSDNAEVTFLGSMTIDEVAINRDWSLKEIQLQLEASDEKWNVTGVGKIVGPKDVRLHAELEFLNEADVKYLRATLAAESELKVHGITIRNPVGTFVSDRDRMNGDQWDPQIEVAGELELPVDLTGPRAEITGNLQFVIPDQEGRRLTINRTGIRTAGELSLEGRVELRLFEVVRVELENPSIQFDGTVEESYAAFRGKLRFTPLQQFRSGVLTPAEFDFSGADRFIKLTADQVSLVGKIGFAGPFAITADNSWLFEGVELDVDTTSNQYTGSLKFKTPDQVFDGRVTLSPQQFEIEVASSEGVAVNFLGFTAIASSLSFVTDRRPEVEPTWDPQLSLQGRLQLPERWSAVTGERIEIAIDEQDRIQVNRDGISATGGALRLPAGIKINLLGLLEVETVVTTEVNLNFARREAELRGQFKIPTLGETVLDLTGGNYVRVRKPDDGPVEYGVVLDVQVPRIDLRRGWSLQDLRVEVVSPIGSVSQIAGRVALVSPGDDRLELALQFAQGRLATLELVRSHTWRFLGITLDMNALRFDADIQPENEDDWEPQVSLAGAIELPASLGQVRVSIPDGQWLRINEQGIELTGAGLTLPNVSFSLAGLIQVRAEDLLLQYTSGSTDDLFKIQGRVEFPSLYGVRADFAGDNYVEIKSSGSIEVRGSIAIQEPIRIVPGVWEIRNALLTIDTIANLVRAQAVFRIPGGIDLEAEVSFLNGELNRVAIAADNINRPLFHPLVMLQRVAGWVDNIASTSSAETIFGGGVGASLGPQLNVNLPSWAGGAFRGSLLRADVNGELDRNHLEASGTIALIGGLATGNGTLLYDWEQRVISGEGQFSFMAGLVQMQGAFHTDYNFNLSMASSVILSMPSFVPLVGGDTFASAQGRFDFTNNSLASDDRVMAWTSVTLPFVGSQVIGIEVLLDGSWRIIGQHEINRSTTGGRSVQGLVSRSSLRDASTEVKETFLVPDGVDYVLLNAEFDQAAAGKVPLAVVAPDGTRIDQADFAAHQIAMVDAMSGPRRQTILISNPEGGSWQLVVDAAGLGKVAFHAFVPTVSPTLQLDPVMTMVAGEQVQVDFASADPDSEATIQLFYDTNNQGFDGILFATGIAEQDGQGTYQWDISELPIGEYFLYGLISDGINAPVLSEYATGSIIVTSGPMQAISGQLFNDVNGNGARDLGDEALTNWTVFLDENRNSRQDAAEPIVLTDSDGAYTFNLPSQQTYVLGVSAPAGWIRTTSAGLPSGTDLVSEVKLLPGFNQTGLDWGWFAMPTWSGTLFDDSNGDGVRQPDEPLLAGRTVLLDRNANGVADPQEQFVQSDAQGVYTLSDVLPGTYLVRQPIAVGVITSPGRELTAQSGQDRNDLDLASFTLGTIEGRVFLDRNADRQPDPDEAGTGTIGLSDMLVYLDLDHSGTLTHNDLRTKTNAQGHYRFTNLKPGQYTVLREAIPSLEQTVPEDGAGYRVTLDTSGQVAAGRDFGNQPRVALQNGDFQISDSQATDYGWSLRGRARISEGRAILEEGSRYLSSMVQAFPIPRGARALRFTVVEMNLSSTPGSPPDSFEVALLDATSGLSLAETARGLTESDAAVNLQANGDAYLGTSTSSRQLSGVGTQIEMDLTHVPSGTLGVLYFDLLGFGSNDSWVVLDDVVLLGVDDLPPVANPDEVTVDVDKAIEIDLLANDIDSDGQIDPTSVVITSDPAHGQVRVDSVTGIVTYQPDEHYEGSDVFTYRVRDMDGLESADATVTILVKQINETPLSFRLSANRVNENEPGGQVGRFDIEDPDYGDTHTIIVDDPRFEVVGNLLRLRSDVSLDFEINPTLTLNVTVTDRGELSINGSVDVLIENVNESPSISNLPAVMLLEDNVLETGVYDLWSFVFDPESADSELLFRFNSAPLSLLNARLEANRYLVLAPARDWFGESTITVEVGDGTHVVQAALNIEIQPVNDAPRFTPGSSIRVAEDSGPFQAIWATQIATGPGNEAAQTVEFLVTTSNASLFTSPPSMTADGVLSFSPAAHANGQTDVTIRLRDNGGTADGGINTSDAVTITIELIPVNDPPTFIDIPAIEMFEDEISKTIDLTLYFRDVETPGREASFTIESTLAGILATIDPSTQVLTIAGQANFSGTGAIQIRATDRGDSAAASRYAEYSLPVTIQAVADTPELSVQDSQGQENQPIRLSVRTALEDTDGSEVLSLLLRGVPSTARLSAGLRQTNGDWLLNPVTDQLANLTVTVDDDGDFALTWIATATERMNGQVASRQGSSWLSVKNVAPTAQFANDGNVPEGTSGRVRFFAADDPSFVDRAVGFRYSYDFNDDGEFEWIHIESAEVIVPGSYLSDGPGQRVVRGRITDQDGGYTDYTTTIMILNVVPTVQISGASSGWVGSPVLLSSSASDPGGSGEQLALSWSVLYAGQAVATATGSSLSFVPDRSGAYRVRLEARDKDGGRGTVEAALNIAGIDLGDAPETYRTSLAQNGARHGLGSTLFLGQRVDAELDAFPGSSAHGDDHNQTIDDEDGVQFLTGLRPGEQTTIQVTASAAGFLQAFFDFDGDGSFAGPGEQVLRNVQVVAGENRFRFLVPTVTCIDCGCGGFNTFARFRISSTRDLSFDGLASDGEVEDYRVAIGTSLSASPVSARGYQLEVAPATPGGTVTFVYSTQPGTFAMPRFGVTLCVANPTFFAQGVVDATGRATVLLDLPEHLIGQTLYVQAFEQATRPSVSPVMTFQIPRSSWLDVNRDGNTTPLDALVIINHLIRASGELAGTRVLPPADFLLRGDVNRDGGITPQDALIVINHLNTMRAGKPQAGMPVGGEGESVHGRAVPAANLSFASQSDETGYALESPWTVEARPRYLPEPVVISPALRPLRISRADAHTHVAAEIDPHPNAAASGVLQTVRRSESESDREQIFRQFSHDNPSWLTSGLPERSDPLWWEEEMLDLLAQQQEFGKPAMRQQAVRQRE